MQVGRESRSRAHRVAVLILVVVNCLPDFDEFVEQLEAIVSLDNSIGFGKFAQVPLDVPQHIRLILFGKWTLLPPALSCFIEFYMCVETSVLDRRAMLPLGKLQNSSGFHSPGLVIIKLYPQLSTPHRSAGVSRMWLGFGNDPDTCTAEGCDTFLASYFLGRRCSLFKKCPESGTFCLSKEKYVALVIGHG